MISRMCEQDAQQSSLGRDVRIPPGPRGSGFSLFVLNKCDLFTLIFYNGDIKTA